MKHILIFFFLCTAIPCGAQWQFIDGNLSTDGSTLAYGVHDTSLFISGGNSVVDRYVSPQHWVTADNGIDFTQGSVTSFASLGRYFFAGIGNGPVYISTNNGGSWSHGTIGSPIATNGTYLFAAYVDPDQIILSKDSGDTWDTVLDLPVNSFAANGSYVFAANANEVWRSIDSGWHWSRDTMPLKTVNSFEFLGTLTFGANGSIIKSTDFGSHWTAITIPNRNVSLLASKGSFLFAGTDSGVFVSLDSGMNWRAVSEGLVTRAGNPIVTALIVFDTLLIAGINAGDAAGYDAARPISEMVDTGKSGVQAVLNPSAISQSLTAYPNPFTHSTTLQFTSPESGYATVTIVNQLGEEVANVFAGEIESGQHSFPVTVPAGLAAGMYECVVRMNGGVQEIPILLTQ